jgi:hypothetical protein
MKGRAGDRSLESFNPSGSPPTVTYAASEGVSRSKALLRERPPIDTWVFNDDDLGFHDWLDGHQDAYFLNLRRSSGDDQAPMLHRAYCTHFNRETDVSWTDTVKVCGETRFVLNRWRETELGTEVQAAVCDCLRQPAVRQRVRIPSLSE